MEEEKKLELPEISQLENELKYERYKKKYLRTLLNSLGIIIVAASIAVLISTLWMPVYEIYGNSMEPTLKDGQIVLTFKGSSFEKGDIVALYYGNKLLVKRVIASPGQWVDIKQDGTVYIDNQKIEEPYLDEKALGNCDISFPYQVPDGKYFFLGDHRATSQDSRSSQVGCASDDQIVGKVSFSIWPLSEFGKIN